MEYALADYAPNFLLANLMLAFPGTSLVMLPKQTILCLVELYYAPTMLTFDQKHVFFESCMQEKWQVSLDLALARVRVTVRVVAL